MQIRYRVPEDPDIDVLWANFVQTTLSGEDFVLTLGQAKPIAINSEEDVRRATRSDREVRVVGQFAVPQRTFIDAIEDIHRLIVSLRERGVIAPVEGEPE